MGNMLNTFYDPEDGCTYFYDTKKRVYRKVCDVGAFTELPDIIKQQIEAASVLALPSSKRRKK